MADHYCEYAELIGRHTEWQKDDETGTEVCKWCHDPRYIVKTVAKATTRKVAKSG